MVKRTKHPKKQIEYAIQFAEEKGWRYQPTGRSAHAWGRLLCPLSERGACSMSVWSTPRDDDIHARQIVRKVNSCPHKAIEEV